PLIAADSPRTRTVTSAAPAAALAAAVSGVAQSMSHPGVNVTFAPGTAALMPSTTGTTVAGSPRPDHGPSRSAWLLPSGPTTATDLTSGENGSVGPAFLSSTIERPATLRAAATSAGCMVLAATCDSSPNGCSNSPARNFT